MKGSSIWCTNMTLVSFCRHGLSDRCPKLSPWLSLNRWLDVIWKDNNDRLRRWGTTYGHSRHRRRDAPPQKGAALRRLPLALVKDHNQLALFHNASRGERAAMTKAVDTVNDKSGEHSIYVCVSEKKVVRLSSGVAPGVRKGDL